MIFVFFRQEKNKFARKALNTQFTLPQQTGSHSPIKGYPEGRGKLANASLTAGRQFNVMPRTYVHTYIHS